MSSAEHTFRTPGGVTIGVEHFGDPQAPLVLLAGGTTMLSWPDSKSVNSRKRYPISSMSSMASSGVHSSSSKALCRTTCRALDASGT